MAMMMFTAILTGINAILIASLLWVYLKNYRQIRASFSLGLLVFASVFLVQKLLSLYIYIVIMHPFEGVVGISLFVLELFQVIAFSVLSWITMR